MTAMINHKQFKHSQTDPATAMIAMIAMIALAPFKIFELCRWLHPAGCAECKR